MKIDMQPTGGLRDVSWFFLPHSKPGTVRQWAERDTDPGVKATVRQIDEDPHSGWSAISLACAVISAADRWGSSRD